MAATADYWVGKTIGEGSFGSVSLCKLKKTGLYVAIKCIDKKSMKNPFAVVQEQKLLKQTKDCCYTVNLYASFHDKECVYLVTECCTAGTLADVCNSQAQHDTVAHYGLQLLEGISFLHCKAAIIHCDLKPENLLLTSAGRLKIADFGCAVPMAQASTVQPAPRGTSAFSSPEIIKGETRLTVAVDLWSFGCVLAALLSGRSPFAAANEAMSVQAITAYCLKPSEDLIFSSDSNFVSQEWKTLVRKLLDPVAKDRLGIDEKDATASNETTAYKSIRQSVVWKLVDLTQDVKYLPDEPSWWKEADKATMKDGKEGFSAFLL